AERHGVAIGRMPMRRIGLRAVWGLALTVWFAGGTARAQPPAPPPPLLNSLGSMPPAAVLPPSPIPSAPAAMLPPINSPTSTVLPSVDIPPPPPGPGSAAAKPDAHNGPNGHGEQGGH